VRGLPRRTSSSPSTHPLFGEPQPEHLLDQLSKYYMLPSVSLRDVIFHAMKANTTFHGHGLTDLYYDRLHPSHHGHTILAQSLQFLLSRAASLPAQAHAWQHEEIAAEEASTRLTPYDRTHASSSWPDGQPGRRAGRRANSRFVRMPTQRDESPAPHQSNSCTGLAPPLPPPMQEGILEAHMECHDAESMHFLGMVDRHRCHGWSYTVERSRWTGAPKPGIIATAPGAQCTFTYALGVPPAPKAGGASPASSAAMPHSSIHRVGVGFLRSYERMGRVALRCVYDCACSPITIDGWWKLSFSPLEVQYISVAIRPQGGGRGARAMWAGDDGAQRHILGATHKFKVAALFINRQVNGTDFIGKYILTTAMEQKGRAAVAGRLEEQAASRRRGRPWGARLYTVL